MSGINHRRSKRLWAVHALALVAAIALILACPLRALARDYEITSVEIAANVESDGSVVVQEARTFDFDGSFRGVYWRIPRGAYRGRAIDPSVIAVGEVVNGSFEPFEESQSNSEHTYVLTPHSNYVEVKLFSSHSDESATFGISYRLNNLATRYADVGELYWKFVSDGWDVESKNVTCTVSLPVPEGSGVWPQENVYAWGHGPLDASVSFVGDQIVYQVPGVGSSEFAEARIAFPESWLSEATSESSSMLSSILAEEQQWADEANAKRTRARVIMGGGTILSLAIPLLSLLETLRRWRRYKQTHKAQFDDQYFRDVPSDDHPAVLGALLHDGEATDECMTAALMRLTDLGYAQLEQVTTTKKGIFGSERQEDDYRLTPLKWPERVSSKSAAIRIDYETMRLVFEQLARLAAPFTQDQSRLYFSSLESVARRTPESYDAHYKGWKSQIKQACIDRGFFVDGNNPGAGIVIALAVLDIFVGVGSVFLFLFLGAPIWLIVLAPIVGCGCGALSLIFATMLDNLSPEAVELKAKLGALRNWLKDFTRLEEAVPQDVILWDRLLVMAVVLGVADEVIKQLKMVAPQILEDTRIASTYGWYYGYGGRPAPSTSFAESFASAHKVSAAKLADSSSSGGGGGGGGFSGGGGGGFGGGGGGGAF